MQKKNMQCKKILAKLAKKSAVFEANTTCPFFGFQQKESQEVKKLRKF